MVVNSYVISITEFGYFFFDCGYLEVAMYCFKVHLLRILEFSIEIVEEFLCWNYLLFPIVGSHRSKRILTWPYIALSCSARLS